MCSQDDVRIPSSVSVLEDKKYFICDTCHRKFASEEALQRHVNNVHLAERPWSCDKCVKEFRSKTALRQHFRSHSDDRPFGCNLCSKKFKQKHHLQEHFSVHSNERPFKCDICGASIKLKSNYIKHMINHNKKTSGSNQSKKKFTKQERLLKSQSEDSKEPLRRENTFLNALPSKQSFNCCECSRSFRSKKELRLHITNRCYEHRMLRDDVQTLSSPMCQNFPELTTTQGNIDEQLSTDQAEEESSLSSDESSSVASDSDRVVAGEKFNYVVFCSACHESFYDHAMLIEHAKKCEKYASILSEEKRKQKAPSEKREYECGFCRLPFESPTLLSEHVKDTHNVDFVFHWCIKFGCDSCDNAGAFRIQL